MRGLEIVHDICGAFTLNINSYQDCLWCYTMAGCTSAHLLGNQLTPKCITTLYHALIGYVWPDAGKQAGLEKHVRVVDYSYPTLIALNF